MPLRLRRWLQFKLRTAFVVLTACSLFFALVINGFILPAQRQADAARENWRFAGNLKLVDWPREEGWAKRLAQRCLPAHWLRNVTEATLYDCSDIPFTIELVRWFPHLEKLEVESPRVTDAHLANLQSLSELTELDLSHTDVHGPGLTYLQRLKSLRRLSLYNSTLADAGLAELNRLPQLEHLDLAFTPLTGEQAREPVQLEQLKDLNLEGTAITDAGLASFTACTELMSLNLADTDISDAGLATVAHFEKLEYLNLSGTRVTDSGLAQLEHLTLLKQLRLNDTGIGDEGLANFFALRSLEVVSLQNTQVSDDGVFHLRHLPRLQLIDLTRTYVTAGGMENLERRKPGCKTVVFGGSLHARWLTTPRPVIPQRERLATSATSPATTNSQP